MKKSRRWKQYAALLCLVSCTFSSSHSASAISLSSITSESIREKESQISDAQNQKKQLQASLTDVQNMKKNLENEKKDLENYVVSLDANLEEIQEKINELKYYIAKDSLERKSLLTQAREALEAKDYSLASDLQIELQSKLEELQKLYATYKRNLF